ncbi:hypothetical protein F5888DRAFT_895808 [Russula emetica]|nr:hypothetical protein F5888DRAFT_895808 [Russula emetica]
MSVSPPPSRWMTPPPVYDSASPVSHSGLTPYLQLPHILSLTWLTSPILSLMFIAFRLNLSSESAQTAISNAKGDLLTGCQAAQKAASSAASMPRFMALATNDQIVDAVNASMDAARDALILSLTIMEAVINFAVDTYRSTFLCFLELVVGGGLSLIIGATQEINSFLQSTFSTLRTSIQNDVATANSAMQTAINGINKVNPFGNITVPQLSIPSLDALQNVTLPTDFQDALTTLNASLPSVSVFKHAVDDLLDTPFEAVKADINSTFAGFNFNSSILPVPDRSTITFCDNLDTSVVDDLGRDLLKITKIGFILIALLMVVLLVGYSFLEWYKWWSLQRHLAFTRKAWMSDPSVVHIGRANEPTMTLTNHNLLILHADSSHPLLTRIAFKIAAVLRLSSSKHINLRWFLHYVFHPPALACFLIGFFGVLSVQLQLLAMAPLEAKFRDQATAAVTDLSGNIFTSLNQSMYNDSASYANSINSHIDSIQSTVNDGLLGWVNGTTSTLNNTVNTFYSDLQDAVSTLFNGTFLEQPAEEFIKCILGTKVLAIEDAITFLHNNLQINIPRVNESVLVLSPDEVNSATQPIAAAAVGSDSDPDGGLIGRLINTYVQSLKKERVMFAIFLLLWAVVVIMGLAIIFWHSYGRDLLNPRRKQKFQRDQRTGFDRVVVPFREEKLTEVRSDTPPLTPIQIRRMEPNDPERPHPVSNLAPGVRKSFDSFFDQASPAAAPPSEEAGGLFSSLARKLPRGSGWKKHLTLALRRDKNAVRKSSRQARRPQLTVSTERVTRTESLPDIERTSPSIIGADRFSVMQQHEPKSTWWNSPDTPTILVANPGTRRKPSVPVSVGGEAEWAMPSPAVAVEPTEFVLPPHIGVARMVHASKLYIPPRSATGHSARVSPSARAVNPFKTPFDDDAGVLHSPVTAKSMTADISFVPVSAASKESDLGEASFAAGRAL